MPENGEERDGRATLTVLSVAGAVAKVIRDGEVQLIPASELYAVEADEKVEGIVIADPTVTGPVLLPNAQDRAEREFNMAERGDAVSKRHAQGSAAPIGRFEEPPALALEEGAYKTEEEERVRRLEAGIRIEEGRETTGEGGGKKSAARKAAAKRAAGEGDEEGGGEGEGGFDPNDPEATPVRELEAALEGASDADVKKARKKDDRASAQPIYERRLATGE